MKKIAKFEKVSYEQFKKDFIKIFPQYDADVNPEKDNKK